MKQAQLYWKRDCELGEGPMFNHQTRELFWVDIVNGILLQKPIDEEDVTEHQFDSALGFAIPTTQENVMILGLSEGVALYNLEKRSYEIIAKVQDDPAIRFNDGKCDPHGRLWMGTMGFKAEPGLGAFYSLTQGKVQQHLSDRTISNGMAWRGERFYYIDSPMQMVQVFDYNGEKGTISNAQKLADVDENVGTPDGMTIDKNGNLWVALYGGAKVIQVDGMTGEMLDEIAVPAPHVTSCTFGGDDFQTLFITTARENLTAEQMKQYPLSGSVFAVQLGVGGRAANFYQI